MNKWIYVVVLLWLSGCAVTPEPTPEAEPDLVQPELLTVDNSHNASIDEEVLYLLMAAELAGQRNQYPLALDAYLQAAKRVDDPRIAERAVKIGLFLKDDKRTKEALQIWLAKDPKNIGARKFAVLVAIKESNRKSAVENLNEMLADDPAGFETGMLEMIKLFEKEGRVQFVYDVLDEVDRLQPSQPKLLFVQALLASIIPDATLAQVKIEQTLQLQPDWNKALIFQAQLAGRGGDLPKARHYLEKALKQAPDDIQLRKLLLQILVNDHAYDEALHLCQTMLDERPDDGETLFAIALIHIQQNQLEKAENNLEHLVKKPEWEDQAAFYLGKLEMERRHADKALAWFDRVEDGKHAMDANLASVSILMSQKRFDEVRERIANMESHHPDQKVRVLMVKAEFLNQLGQYQQAIDVLDEALKEVPEDRDVLYAQALVAERLGRLELMERDLHKILDKNPDDVAALNAMGYSLVNKTTRYDEAEKYLDHALKLQPDEPVIIDSYGWLLFKRGQPEKALEYLRKAYVRLPENEIVAHLAEVLWTLGNEKDARELFDNAYKKSPDDEYLLEFRNRFYHDGQK
jgi:tetratricopeptide (TPR) repeat protein